jgi:lysophospholipase L1-like esterase
MNMNTFAQRNLTLLTLLLAAALVVSAQNSNSVPTLYLIGDSTVNTPTKGQQGWGTALPALFDQTKIAVVNRARGGRSSRTFYTESLWDQVRDSLKRGDFVLMQFGHNDGGPLDEGRARASLKGNGEETQDVDNKTTGKNETVHTYGWYLRKYVADAKAKGATPIVLSPIPRNIWKDGKVARAANEYGKWAAEAAKTEGALFINLNEIVSGHYEEFGQPKVAETYFTATDHTHTTPEGAKFNAACVVEGIRSLKDCSLANYLLPAERQAEK